MSSSPACSTSSTSRSSAPHRYRGQHDAGDRDVIDGSQVLAQSIVAATQSCPGRSCAPPTRSSCAPVAAARPIELAVEVRPRGSDGGVGRGSSARQGGRTKVDVLLLLDVAQPDVVRRSARGPTRPARTRRSRSTCRSTGGRSGSSTSPTRTTRTTWGRRCSMPGSATTSPPSADDLVRALLAHFTGHLSISTIDVPPPGPRHGPGPPHDVTGVMTIGVAFHEPVTAAAGCCTSTRARRSGPGCRTCAGRSSARAASWWRRSPRRACSAPSCRRPAPRRSRSPLASARLARDPRLATPRLPR